MHRRYLSEETGGKNDGIAILENEKNLYIKQNYRRKISGFVCEGLSILC